MTAAPTDVPHEFLAAARELNAAWLALAAAWPDEVEKAAAGTGVVFGDDTEAAVGIDALGERFIISDTAKRTFDVLDVIAPGGQENIDRVVGLLRHPLMGPEGFVARIAQAACPTSAEAQREFVEWVDWAHSRHLNLLDVNDVTTTIGFSHWKYNVAPRLGTSYPALPSELVRPLAQCLSGECTFAQASEASTWTARFRSEAVGELLEDAVRARPRANVHHMNPGLSAPAEFGQLGSIATHRLLREFVTRAWEEKFITGTTDAGRIIIPGGWPKLAEDFGIRGAAGRDALRLAGTLLNLLSVRLPGGVPTSLLHLHLRGNPDGEVPGRKCLDIKLVNELLPGAVLRRARTSDKILVPLPPCLPPLPSTKLAGRACAYQMLLLRELRLRAVEFAGDRTIDLPTKVRDKLAYDVGLSKDNRLAVEEPWFADGPDQFLVKDGSRIRLAARYWTLDAFLREGARRSQAGKAARARRKKK